MQDRFQKIMDTKHLNAKQIASMINIDASSVSHILNGKRKPGYEVLAKLGQAFPDINMNWLVTGNGNMYNNNSSSVNDSSPLPIDMSSEIEDISKSVPDKTTQAEDVVVKANPFSTTTTRVSQRSKTMPSQENQKKLKMVILFYDDGTMEEYGR